MRLLLTFLLFSSLALVAMEPEEVVLAVLQETQSGKFSVLDDERVALSPYCGPDRKELIKSRWLERAKWFSKAGFQFRILAKEIDEELGGIVVGLIQEKNPAAVAILSFGVIRRDGAWKVTPFEVFFENVALPFEGDSRERAASLERWMSRTRASQLTKLQDELYRELREQVAGEVSADELATEDAEAVVLSFLQAAREGKVNALLSWQGLLEQEELLNRDWERIIEVARQGLGENPPRSEWRLLSSDRVMKAIVDEDVEANQASYLVSFLSRDHAMEDERKLAWLRFDLTRTKSGWRVGLPPVLLTPKVKGIHNYDHLDWDDRQHAQRIGHHFEQNHRAVRSDGAAELLASLHQDLQKRDLQSYLKRFYREHDLLPDREEHEKAAARGEQHDIDWRRLERYQAAVAWWHDVSGVPQQPAPVSRKFYEGEDVALALFTSDHARSGWKIHWSEIWFAKSEAGWMILSDPKDLSQEGFSPKAVKQKAQLSKEARRDRKELETGYAASLVEDLVVWDPAASLAATLDVKTLIKEWQETIRSGDFASLMALSAVRTEPEPPTRVLQTVSYARKDIMMADANDEYLGTMQAGPFFGVSMMMDKGQGVEKDCPLRIVVASAQGARVLVDIELPLATNKGLKLLNDARLEDLEKELAADDFESLTELYQWHQKLALPRWTEWKAGQVEQQGERR